VENQVTIIEQYAKSSFGITLTKWQLEYMQAVADGKAAEMVIPKSAGKSVADTIMRAHLDAALKPVPDSGKRKYWYKITPGLLDVLFIMVQYVHEQDRNEFTIKEIRDRLKPFQYTQTTKLRFHGLIAKIKDDNGVHHGKWLITRRAGEFMRNEIVLPQKVQTQNNKVIDYDDYNVSIRDVYGDDLYLEGREQFIRARLPQ
jgi:hypothetical protein